MDNSAVDSSVQPITQNLPRRVIVESVVASRYQPGDRPLRWENRQAGIDQIVATTGEKISLLSSGGQSSPAPGWELLLMEERKAEDMRDPVHVWTLYGIRQGASGTGA